jgi:hypothetical protein
MKNPPRLGNHEWNRRRVELCAAIFLPCASRPYTSPARRAETLCKPRFQGYSFCSQSR